MQFVTAKLVYNCPIFTHRCSPPFSWLSHKGKYISVLSAAIYFCPNKKNWLPRPYVSIFYAKKSRVSVKFEANDVSQRVEKTRKSTVSKAPKYFGWLYLETNQLGGFIVEHPVFTWFGYGQDDTQRQKRKHFGAKLRGSCPYCGKTSIFSVTHLSGAAAYHG